MENTIKSYTATTVGTSSDDGFGDFTVNMGAANEIITIPSAYLGVATAQIRLHYNSTGASDSYWGIDNLSISGTPITYSGITWSPTTALYTDAGLTTAYTGTTATSVYAEPASSATYTASITAAGCTGTANAVVNIAPLFAKY